MYRREEFIIRDEQETLDIVKHGKKVGTKVVRKISKTKIVEDRLQVFDAGKVTRLIFYAILVISRFLF